MLLSEKSSARPARNPLPPKLAALVREFWWFALVGLALYLLLVLYTYDKSDPGWSRSVSMGTIENAGGDLLAGRIVRDLAATNAEIERLSERFLANAAPAVAASELQKLTKDMAAQAGTEMRSERILPPVERGELLEIPVEIAVSGEIRQLVDLLTRLEETQKLLTIQDLRVRVVNVSQPRELLATLTVSGFILPGKSKT